MASRDYASWRLPIPILPGNTGEAGEPLAEGILAFLENAEGWQRDGIGVDPLAGAPIELGGALLVDTIDAVSDEDIIMGTGEEAKEAAYRLTEIGLAVSSEEDARAIADLFLRASQAGNWTAASKLVDLAHDQRCQFRTIYADFASRIESQIMQAAYADNPTIEVIDTIEGIAAVGNIWANIVLAEIGDSNPDAILAADRLLTYLGDDVSESERVVLAPLCRGPEGERRLADARAARDSHPDV